MEKASAAIEAALSVLPALDPTKDWRHKTALEASAGRSARIVEFAAFFLIVLGIATAVWLISVAALRWRPALSRGLNRLCSMFSFAPPLLFLAGLTFLVAYYPYALSIRQFASQEELNRGYTPFFANLYNFMNFGTITDAWLSRMFWPSIWCAAVALAGAALLHWVARRERPGRTGEA
jgi:Flp pilus assembly protein TadB